jgi:hypothetical protein
LHAALIAAAAAGIDEDDYVFESKMFGDGDSKCHALATAQYFLGVKIQDTGGEFLRWPASDFDGDRGKFGS